MKFARAAGGGEVFQSRSAVSGNKPPVAAVDDITSSRSAWRCSQSSSVQRCQSEPRQPGLVQTHSGSWSSASFITGCIHGNWRLALFGMLTTALTFLFHQCAFMEHERPGPQGLSC